jgi:pimeloyl-ACP methyl ester carboxylesterase
MFEPNFVTAPDGRSICFSEHGDLTGPAIFLFHGTPGSRLDHDPYDRPTAARIITIDRPGYGQSDPQPNRRLVDWPADVLAVADALGLDRFCVLGISGGGPHALACAALVPHRIRRVGVVCGVGPLDDPAADAGMQPSNALLNHLSRSDPKAVHDIGEMMAAGITGATDPSALMTMSTSEDMPEVDRATMAHPAVQAMMFATLKESMRQGGTAFAQEMIMLAQPWGFALEDIEVEVRFLQGTDDVNVPLAHAEAMAARLPGATLTVMQGEGHMSLAIDHSTPFALELITE